MSKIKDSFNFQDLTAEKLIDLEMKNIKIYLMLKVGQS